MTNETAHTFSLCVCVCAFAQQGFSCCSPADWSVRAGLSYHGNCHILRSPHPMPPTTHAHTHKRTHAPPIWFFFLCGSLLPLGPPPFSRLFSIFFVRDFFFLTCIELNENEIQVINVTNTSFMLSLCNAGKLPFQNHLNRILNVMINLSVTFSEFR